MKSILIIAIFVIAVGLPQVSDASPIASQTLLRRVRSLDQEWENYKKEHNRNYPTAEEDARRRALYEANLAHINAHNEKFKKGEVTWEMGLNQFSDRTPEELKRMHGVRLPLQTNHQ